MTSEVLSAAAGNNQRRGAAVVPAFNPHVTTVNISEAAIMSSVYRLSTDFLHHRWLLRQSMTIHQTAASNKGSPPPPPSVVRDGIKYLSTQSWYFGAMTRQEASDLLMSEREGGVFLVRDSASIQGDYVLCVREDNKVSHYIINKIQQGEQTRYRIGDQMFTDLPSLLNFYKVHYLDTTPLIRPAPKRVEKVLAKYDFEGNDPDDLPFRKGEVLTVVSKDEEQWWTARNALGQTGSIPVPYICKVDDNSSNKFSSPATLNSNNIHSNGSSNNAQKSKGTSIHRKLPAFARVKQARVPNAYDKTALRLDVGDIVKVTKMSINGQWEGELNGKVGHFPFTHVEFIDSNDSGIEEHS